MVIKHYRLMKRSLLLAGTIILVFFCGMVHAQDTLGGNTNIDGRMNVVSTAVPFLRISPDARSGGMGDAGIALSPDANAVFWNLSKLPFAKENAAASVTYTPWLTELVNDVFLATLSGYKKIDDYQAIGASLRYFSLGNVDLADINGQPQGTFNPREFAFDAGYARKLSDNWSVGLALRYIYSNLASGQVSPGGQTYKAGQSVAGDVSAYYTKDMDQANGQTGNLSLGLTITNMGTKISYASNGQKNFIPTNLGLGGAYTTQLDEYNKITLALDANKLLVPTPPAPGDSAGNAKYSNEGVVQGIFTSFSDAPGGFKEEMQEVIYSAGIEYWYNNLFAVRAGYFHEAPNKGDRQYFTVGLGLKYNAFGLNFSYLVPSGSGVNRNPLSNTLRFSLLFDLSPKQQQ